MILTPIELGRQIAGGDWQIPQHFRKLDILLIKLAVSGAMVCPHYR